MIFPFPRIEIDPWVIMPTQRSVGDDMTFDKVQLFGKFRRVFPSSAFEVQILASLKHRIDKFAPNSEGGVILTEAAYQNITGKGDK
jgi:hypothetical protein